MKLLLVTRPPRDHNHFTPLIQKQKNYITQYDFAYMKYENIQLKIRMPRKVASEGRRRVGKEARDVKLCLAFSWYWVIVYEVYGVESTTWPPNASVVLVVGYFRNAEIRHHGHHHPALPPQ